MDRPGRLAAWCLVLLVGVAPMLPLLGAWAPPRAATSLVLALIGGAALLVEARRGVARPGLGTPVDKAFGAWLVLSALAGVELEQLLTLGLAHLLAIRTLTTPERVRDLLLMGLALTALAGSLARFLDAPAFGEAGSGFALMPLLAGIVLTFEQRPAAHRLLVLALVIGVAGSLRDAGRDTLFAAALALGVSAGLQLSARPGASRTLQRLTRLAGKALLLAALAAAALVAARATGLLGDSLGSFGARSQFVAPLAAQGGLALLPLIALLTLIWETRRVAIRGAHLLAGDDARRSSFHALAAALVGALGLACFGTPLSSPASGVWIVVLLAALSRAGCDSRERVATGRAQLVAVVVVLLVLAWVFAPVLVAPR